MMLKIFISLWILFSIDWGAGHGTALSRDFSQKPVTPKEMVILLHGLGRTRCSMKKMERYLMERGYETINVDYPSTQKTVDAIVNDHLLPVITACRDKGAVKIHVVTHSLGGIVLRRYLENNPLPKGSRAVMLAPPNHGSELADFLKGSSFFTWLIGPTLQELGTDPKSLPNRMPPLSGIDVGVITGDTDRFPIFGALFPGPNDGKVSVESAKLDGMKAFKTISCGHTFIMDHPDVMAAVDQFLKEAAFF